MFRYHSLRPLLLAGMLAVAASIPGVAQERAVDPGTVAFRSGDMAGAMAAWKPMAEAGDPRAQFNLGVLYDEGLGVAADRDAAQRWWQQAAAQGLPEAQHSLALLEIDKPDGGNFESALTNLRAAAEAGHAPARYTLGRMYDYGLGVAADPVVALDHVRQAAEAGLPAAQYNMGKRYRDGTGITVDTVAAAAWFRRAAFAGHAGGQDHFARRLKDGVGVATDPVAAMTMAILAVRGGYPDARDLAEELKTALSIEQLDRAFQDAGNFIAARSSGPLSAPVPASN